MKIFINRNYYYFVFLKVGKKTYSNGTYTFNQKLYFIFLKILSIGKFALCVDLMLKLLYPFIFSKNILENNKLMGPLP